jgi:hypothetical protein
MGADIEADHGELAGKGNGQRQADIAQPDDTDSGPIFAKTPRCPARPFLCNATVFGHNRMALPIRK